MLITEACKITSLLVEERRPMEAEEALKSIKKFVKNNVDLTLQQDLQYTLAAVKKSLEDVK